MTAAAAIEQEEDAVRPSTPQHRCCSIKINHPFVEDIYSAAHHGTNSGYRTPHSNNNRYQIIVEDDDICKIYNIYYILLIECVQVSREEGGSIFLLSIAWTQAIPPCEIR